MSPTGRARGLPFHRLHFYVTYAIAGLGLFALTRGDQVGLPGKLAFGLGFLLSGFLGSSRPRAATDLTRRVAFWNGLMGAALALQVARFFVLDESVLPLAFELAGALQIAKLFNRNAARDHQQIQALAFLHLIGASVLTTGLDYALIFFGFVVLMPWMLALTQMRSEIERHYGGPPVSGADLDDERRQAATIGRVLRSRRIAGPGFLLGTAGLAVPLFLITAAFFLLFPRVGMGFLSFGAGAGQPVAGFGSNVDLGDFGVIRDDPTVVLRVRPRGGDGNPAAARTFRLRGTAFDQYRDGSWTRTGVPFRRLRRDGASSFYPLVEGALEDRAVGSHEIVLDPLGEKVVFTLPGTLGISTPPHVVGGMDEPRRLTTGLGAEVRYSDGDGLPLRYTLFVDGTDRPAGDDLDEATAARYLQLPEGQERVSDLAAIVAGDGSDTERARRLEGWLRDSGELTYTLDQPDTRGRDPLAVFLFDAKRGHCEYFSTALAVMLRAQGIPSRNVTGFVGGAFNEYGGYYAIRQGDAHSWVEAWLKDRWVTLDPTPVSRDALRLPSGALAELQAMLDALRMRWSRDVVGYDLRDQVDGLRGLFRYLRSFRSESEREERRGVDPQRREEELGPLVTAALVVIPVVILLSLLLWWRRRRASRASMRDRRRASPAEREAVTLYQELDARLRRLGVGRPPSRTPSEHLDHLRSDASPRGRRCRGGDHRSLLGCSLCGRGAASRSRS